MVLQKDYLNLLKEVADNDEHAFNYLVAMSKILRVWDDLYDGDKVVSKEDIDEVFCLLTFELGINPFFVAHRKELESFMVIAWNAWRDANNARLSDDPILKSAGWFYRNYCCEIDILVAFLVGGKSHVDKVGEMCRKYYLNLLVLGGPDGYV